VALEDEIPLIILVMSIFGFVLLYEGLVLEICSGVWIDKTKYTPEVMDPVG